MSPRDVNGCNRYKLVKLHPLKDNFPPKFRFSKGVVVEINIKTLSSITMANSSSGETLTKIKNIIYSSFGLSLKKNNGGGETKEETLGESLSPFKRQRESRLETWGS